MRTRRCSRRLSDARSGTVRAEHVPYMPVACALLALVGCVEPTNSGGPSGRDDAAARAMDYLKAALRYESNPAVRVQAVEALQDSDDPGALPWIRSAILDDHPGVRFAACLAVGRNRDAGGGAGVDQCLADPDPSVRLAAIYARHRLGRTDRTGDLAGALLTHTDPAVRRNAALILGLLGEPAGIRVLAKAMKDSDLGVRRHALEAMAKLGNAEAKQELVFLANSGVGADELFAVSALADTCDPHLADAYGYKLENAEHVETRLAAARALGLLGNATGFQSALSALRSPKATSTDPADPAPAQELRIQQLAAGALGAMRQPRALGDLRRVMDGSVDPRVQVSAAKAIVNITGPPPSVDAPFAQSQRR